MAEGIDNELPAGWTVEGENTSDLPVGWSVEDRPEKKAEKWFDPVSAEIRAAGYEPDSEEELERLIEHKSANLLKGLFSGATVGLSENIPGLQVEPGAEGFVGEFTGSILPISGLMKVFTGPAVKLAAKSPYFQKGLSSLAHLTGVGLAGATYGAAEKITKEHKMPTQDDLIDHGATWIAVDLAVSALGKAGVFAWNLGKKALEAGKSKPQLMTELAQELEASGVNLSDTEAVGLKAMEILERPLTEAEQAAGGLANRVKLQEAETAQPFLAQKQGGQLGLGGSPEQIAQRELTKQKFAKEEVGPLQLKNEAVAEEPIKELTDKTVELSEPIQPEGVNFSKEATALEDSALRAQVEAVGERAVSKQELGTTIREEIESDLAKAKAEYAPFYTEAEAAAESIEHIPTRTAKEAGNKLIKITDLKTKPEGYKKVIGDLETALEDAGYIVEKDKAGNIVQIIQDKKVPVSRTIELAKRLNQMVDFESIDPDASNILKKVVGAAKQDIRTGLAANPDALASFEFAEAEHARVAQKYGTDAIRRIRKTEAGERIGAGISAPTNLENLGKVLSPQRFAQVQREILEDLSEKSYEQGQKQLREIKKHLSKENQKLAEKIVETKNPHNPAVRKQALQDAILDDLSNAFTSGNRPEKTLKLWQTPKGRKAVEETFKDSPNWQGVKSYLEKQSFNDLVTSVMKDGHIDIKKLDQFMKDPGVIENIRTLGGEDAVNFFKDLKTYADGLRKNTKLLKLEKLEGVTEGGLNKKIGAEKEKAIKGGEKLFKQELGVTPKAMISLFTVFKIGIPKSVLAFIGYKMFTRLATNANARKAFIKAAQHYTNPKAFISAMENLGDAVDEE